MLSNTGAGFALSNAFAMAAMAISKYTIVFNDDSKVIFWAEFIVIPILMGIISAWCWRHDENVRGWKLATYSFYNIGITIILSSVFLGEGVICLIIVSPLLYVFVLMGAFAGWAMFKRKNNTLSVSIVTALIALFIMDGYSKHYYVNEVSDKIVINAPVAQVWPYVVAYDRIQEKPKYWLFRIGMPSPVQSTATAYKLGASRKCIFSNGYTFDEKITAFDVNHNLTFDITNQPRDPEIMGHIDILRGQFLLHDNGNGTTTVTGNSWYQLYVFPAWYYDLWAKSIVRNVHIRVMERVKQLCEEKQKAQLSAVNYSTPL